MNLYIYSFENQAGHLDYHRALLLTLGHLLKGEGDHAQGLGIAGATMIMQHVIHCRGTRELGRPAKTALNRVEGTRQGLCC